MWPPYGHPHKSSATVVSCIIKMAIMCLIHVHLVQHFFFVNILKQTLQHTFCVLLFIQYVLYSSRLGVGLSCQHIIIQHFLLTSYFLRPINVSEKTYSKIVQIPLKGSLKKMILLLLTNSICCHFCSTIFWHCYIFEDVKLLLIALNYCIQEKKVSLKFRFGIIFPLYRAFIV